MYINTHGYPKLISMMYSPSHSENILCFSQCNHFNLSAQAFCANVYMITCVPDDVITSRLRLRAWRHETFITTLLPRKDVLEDTSSNCIGCQRIWSLSYLGMYTSPASIYKPQFQRCCSIKLKSYLGAKQTKPFLSQTLAKKANFSNLTQVLLL